MCFFQTDSQCSKLDPAVCTNCISVTRLDVVFLGKSHLKRKRMLKSHWSCLITAVSMLCLVGQCSSPQSKPVLMFWGHVAPLPELKCPEQLCKGASLKTPPWICTSSFCTQPCCSYSCVYTNALKQQGNCFCLNNYRSKTFLVKNSNKSEEKRALIKKFVCLPLSARQQQHTHTHTHPYSWSLGINIKQIDNIYLCVYLCIYIHTEKPQIICISFILEHCIRSHSNIQWLKKNTNHLFSLSFHGQEWLEQQFQVLGGLGALLRLQSQFGWGYSPTHLTGAGGLASMAAHSHS